MAYKEVKVALEKILEVKVIFHHLPELLNLVFCGTDGAGFYCRHLRNLWRSWEVCTVTSCLTGLSRDKGRFQ